MTLTLSKPIGFEGKPDNKLLPGGFVSPKDDSHEVDEVEIERTSKLQSLKEHSLPILVLLMCCLMLFHIALVQYHRESPFSWNTPDYTRYHDLYRYTPEQLHLSLGSHSSEIYVTWSTRESVASKLEYSRADSSSGLEVLSVQGKRIPWKIDSVITTKSSTVIGLSTRTIYTYRARMNNLKVGGRYTYRVVATSPSGTKFYSKTYSFTVKDLESSATLLRVAMYGDLGLINGQSVPRLIEDVDKQKYDIIIHNGDFAYDLDTNQGEYGDRFMREIEPIAARVPYQTSVGNHENADNFTHYDKRFTMVNSGGLNDGQINNFFYSFNAGPVHFIAISTEFYYYRRTVGHNSLKQQYLWLIKDLQQANKERAKRPWIIVFGHRPMYCSSADGDDCTKDSNLLRKGVPPAGSYALEELLYDNGVDVLLFAHEHQYERFLPLYDGLVMNGTDSNDPYFNPRAPVHIISGSAGCQERLDPFELKPVNGSVKRISDYGYTRMMASRCSLHFEQISDDCGGCIADRFVVTKDKQNFPEEVGVGIECGQDLAADVCVSQWCDGSRECTSSCSVHTSSIQRQILLR